MAFEATGRASQRVAEKYTPQDIILTKINVSYDDFEELKGLTDCPYALALCQKIPLGCYHGGSEFSAACIFIAAQKNKRGTGDGIC